MTLAFSCRLSRNIATCIQTAKASGGGRSSFALFDDAERISFAHAQSLALAISSLLAFSHVDAGEFLHLYRRAICVKAADVRQND